MIAKTFELLWSCSPGVGVRKSLRIVRNVTMHSCCHCVLGTASVTCFINFPRLLRTSISTTKTAVSEGHAYNARCSELSKPVPFGGKIFN